MAATENAARDWGSCHGMAATENLRALAHVL